MTLWYEIISTLPFDWSEFRFMQHALLAALIICPLLAFLGCMVVNNQMAFFSDAIGHAGLTGIAAGAIIGLTNPLWSMIIFSVFLAVCITLLRRFGAASGDTVIGIVMSSAVALGIVILSRGGGFNKYSNFLIGDLLSIAPEDIFRLLLVAVLFLIAWVTLFNRIFLVSVNSSLARSRKVPILFTQTAFAIITALTVTISIQWIGILVINALIILPAATSRNVARSTMSYLWTAAGISIIAGVTGLITSFYWSTATGATIVLFTAFLYSISLIVKTAGKNK
jgi:zinc transport system permease protein